MYALGFAVPMVLGGELGDLYGRRRPLPARHGRVHPVLLVATLAEHHRVDRRASPHGISASAMVPRSAGDDHGVHPGSPNAPRLSRCSVRRGREPAIGKVLGGVLPSSRLRYSLADDLRRPGVLMGVIAFGAALRWLPDTRCARPPIARPDRDGLLGLACTAARGFRSPRAARWAGRSGAGRCCKGNARALRRIHMRWRLRLHRGDRVRSFRRPCFDSSSYRVGLVVALMLGPRSVGFAFLCDLTRPGLGWSPMHAAPSCCRSPCASSPCRSGQGSSPRFGVPQAPRHRRPHPSRTPEHRCSRLRVSQGCRLNSRGRSPPLVGVGVGADPHVRTASSER
ncbi:hypothetical protein LV779_36750 [Streptomyces thinghirensis]|nr:hypothetical protein [Streptomyces thinghirensis]